MPSTTDPDELKKAIMHRNQLLVTNIDSQQVDDVGKWFAAVKQNLWYSPVPGSPGAPPVGDAAAGTAAGAGGRDRRCGGRAATAPPGPG